MKGWQISSVAALIILFFVSLLTGADYFSLSALWCPSGAHFWLVLIESRIPRTLAVAIVGASLSIAGLLMQMLVRNRFAEPATTGTMEGAMLGFLISAILFPEASLLGKTMIAACTAACSGALYLAIVRQMPLRSAYLAPLIGLILGGIIYAIATALALEYNLGQSLYAWMYADFSGVIRGRYELLWMAFALGASVYYLANAFTVAGMGRDLSAGLGLNYSALVALGLVVVSAISAIVVIVVGSIAFIGLVIPNFVRMLHGDNVKATSPWVALWGAAFLLFCDLAGRLVNYPHEIPVGTVVGVVGSALLLFLLKARKIHVG